MKINFDIRKRAKLPVHVRFFRMYSGLQRQIWLLFVEWQSEIVELQGSFPLEQSHVAPENPGLHLHFPVMWSQLSALVLLQLQDLHFLPNVHSGHTETRIKKYASNCFISLYQIISEVLLINFCIIFDILHV